MSYREPDLFGEFQILQGIHRWNTNFNTEMTALVSALGSDSTTHDSTIETRSAALTFGLNQTRAQNDALLLINAAKGGGLSNLAIISAIDDALGIAHVPAVIDVPFASANAKPPVVGTVCSVTNGNWTGTPSSYAYQWKRDGTTNLGTAANYTLVSADIGGHQIACLVTATNVTGSTPAPISNAIAT